MEVKKFVKKIEKNEENDQNKDLLNKSFPKI